MAKKTVRVTKKKAPVRKKKAPSLRGTMSAIQRRNQRLKDI